MDLLRLKPNPAEYLPGAEHEQLLCPEAVDVIEHSGKCRAVERVRLNVLPEQCPARHVSHEGGCIHEALPFNMEHLHYQCLDLNSCISPDMGAFLADILVNQAFESKKVESSGYQSKGSELKLAFTPILVSGLLQYFVVCCVLFRCLIAVSCACLCCHG